MSASGPSGPLVLFFFALKRLSTFYVCFKYLSSLHTRFYHESKFNTMNPDQTAPLGAFCLCDLILYIPVNNFSVMSGLVFLF